MKSVLIWLSVCLILVLSSSCALGAGRGRVQCDPPVLPVRPPETICIASGNGSGQCYVTATGKWETRPMLNHVCVDASTDARREEWIQSVLRSVGQ